MSEQIVLCDEHGRPTGQADKLASHHGATPLHLAFSCYVFDAKNRFLVTKRAYSKKVWPGVWTNSVCGHPAPGEDIQGAIERRLDYELGMTAKDITVVLPAYRYKTPAYNGVIENEFCPVFVARATSEPAPNIDEVADYKWLSWVEFVALAEADMNDSWSWWCKDQLKQLKDSAVLKSYLSR